MKKNINKLAKRILDISIKHNLSHLGSCLTSLPIIYKIFKNKNENDKFVLSNGHSAIALYVVLEEFYNIDAEYLFKKHGIHPERDMENKIFVSTGSLGLGITIATGMALSNQNNTIHCLISDGECAEGSVWESLRFIDENNLKNVNIYVNINGWGAYKKIDSKNLSKKLKSFLPKINIFYTDVNKFIEFETPLGAHYKIANNNMIIK